MRESFRNEFRDLIEPLAQYRRRRLWEMFEEMENHVNEYMEKQYGPRVLACIQAEAKRIQ